MSKDANRAIVVVGPRSVVHNMTTDVDGKLRVYIKRIRVVSKKDNFFISIVTIRDEGIVV